MMAFTLPNFNVPVKIWRGPQIIPPLGVAAVITVGNLTPGRRGTQLDNGQFSIMYLLLPAGTDVRAVINAAVNDVIEVPAGSGRYYEATFVDDVAKGFANEHRLVHMFQRKVWPAPMP